MTRRAADRLRKFLAAHAAAPGALPLTHITRAYSFDEMLEGEALEPSHCDVFKEPLIYLFYGRPAYRAKLGNNARLEFEWPVVFIFHPDKISSIKRLFPFDTGAFSIGLYESFFDRKARLDDFSLEPSLEAARTVVSAFYVDQKEYFLGSTRKNIDLPIRQFEAQGLFELARLPGDQSQATKSGGRDERSSAIEIQVSEPIAFKDALLAIVLPEAYLDDAEVKAALSRWGVQIVETYPSLHNTSGDVWVGQVYNIVYGLYRKLGLLK